MALLMRKKLCAYGEAAPCEFKPTFACFNYRSPAFFCICHAIAGSLAQAVVCAGHLGCNYFFFWCRGENDVPGDEHRSFFLLYGKLATALGYWA